MPGIRANYVSYAKSHAHRYTPPLSPPLSPTSSGSGSDTFTRKARVPSAPSVPTVTTRNTAQPIIIVHNHIPKHRCCHGRKRAGLRPRKVEAPKPPEVTLPGWRGKAQRCFRWCRRMGLYVLQAGILLSSLVPRINIGIGINPVWPESWPSFLRRR